MTEVLYHPIAILENDDFDSQGNLKLNVNKPVLIMIQANFCHFCTLAKPAFQEFADKHPEVFVATIQGDPEKESQKKLSKRLNSMFKDFRGFPEYVLYVNGKYKATHPGGRTVKDLEAFVNANK